MAADPLNPWDLGGSAVLVTGGGRGIGRVIAARFLAAGAEVMVCGRTEPETLPVADGRSARFVPADVRDPGQAGAAVTATVDAFGRLDVLVNNAGGAPPADAATMSPRLFDAVLSINLSAAFYTAQAAHRALAEAGGCIVNIGSVNAGEPQPGTAAYTAAKAGLLALTRALALEWAPAVRVNHLTVGPVASEQLAEYFGGGETGRAVLSRLDTGIAMGRMAQPDDVAAACLYLASPLAGYVSGADLAVRGGGEFPARFLATRPNSQ